VDRRKRSVGSPVVSDETRMICLSAEEVNDGADVMVVVVHSDSQRSFFPPHMVDMGNVWVINNLCLSGESLRGEGNVSGSYR